MSGVKKARRGRGNDAAPRTEAADALQHHSRRPAPAAASVPAAVIMLALGQSLPSSSLGSGKAQVATTDQGNCFVEVEVETKQGYLYAGKLIHMDAHYNIVLREVLVRRERLFDIERELLQRQHQSLLQLLPDGGGAGELEAGAAVVGRGPRPRYLDRVCLRSNNVVLMRFVDAANMAKVAPAAGSLSSTSPPPPPPSSSSALVGALQSSFQAMAAAVKTELMQIKMRNRADRRRRLEAKKKMLGAAREK